MTAPVRRLALVVHLTCSVGWIGAVIAYMALGVAVTTSTGPGTVLAAWVGMEVIGWYVLVPLALGSWATGLLMLRRFRAPIGAVLTFSC